MYSNYLTHIYIYVCTFALNEASDRQHLTPQLVPFETAMMNLQPNAEAVVVNQHPTPGMIFFLSQRPTYQKYI